ncbi:MAG: restriction endonuclease subunit M [Alphaproteobacteria bacterium]|nr:MAG: restriction endonuclease subunit M [Alphaproteobacteria bacterium]
MFRVCSFFVKAGGDQLVTNKLYYGDNLPILRDHIADGSVDLVYLDPPFNSNATYNVLFKAPSGEQSQAQIEAFDDTWHWTEAAENAYWEVLHGPNTDAARMLEAMRGFLGENDMMAYLAMMAIRLIELHRVLKPTGSLYLHCDPTASHYLKILLDAVFGKDKFLNEVIWRRTGSHNNAKRFGPIHDVILFFQKSNSYRHNPVFRPYLKGHVDSYFKKADSKGQYWTNSIHGAGVRYGASGQPWRGYDPTAVGRHWAVPSELVVAFGIDPELPQHEKLDALADLGLIDFPPLGSPSLPTYRQYLHSSPGLLLQDIWAYQPHTRGVLYNSDQAIDEDVRWLTAQGDEERLGYRTQKPQGLLERIISASSNPGDVVLDPFCGCGTTVHAAQKLGRQWIGIDVTHLAISLIERRLRDAFGKEVQFETIGVPKDIGAARDLATRDKHEFEKWAITLIPDAQPFRGGRKGADTGIDGIVYMRTAKNVTDKAIVEVKGGGVSVDQIHKLKSVIEREKALVGLFVTLEPPTKPMIAEAAAAGFAETAFGRIPRIQILTIQGLLEFREFARLPAVDASAFRKAPKEKSTDQGALDL